MFEALKKHVSSKRLVPKPFRDENRIEEIRGVYVPFWIFDADASASASYKATKVRFWSDSRYNYTETRHFKVLRSGDISFRAIPVDGSSKMPNEVMESIEPFDLSEAVDFKTAYLAGYLADMYDVEAEVCSARINERVKKSSEDALRSTVMGYNSVIAESTSVKLVDPKTRYALLPVWMLNTEMNGKR